MVNVHLVLTGASGYLGQHLLGNWIRNGCCVSSDSTDGENGSCISSLKITALYNRSEKFPDALKAFQSTCASTSAASGTELAKPKLVSEVSVEQLDLCDEEQIAKWLTTTFPSSSSDETTSDDDTNKKRKIDDDVHVVVVHTAALANPRLCQQDPDKARKINIPKTFFDAIRSLETADDGSGTGTGTGTAAVRRSVTMIALSTDQVYDGKLLPESSGGSFYTEGEQDALKPVNVYGETKFEMEEYLKTTWLSSSSNNNTNTNALQNDVGITTNSSRRLHLLRSSIILGPKAPIDPTSAHDTFLHFVESRGGGDNSKEPTTFFTNEYRTVISVRKVINIIDDLIMKSCSYSSPADDDSCQTTLPVIWNMGGSVRANRLDMAKTVFDHYGYNDKLLLPSEQNSPNVPLDISMDCSQLKKYGIADRVGDESLKDIVEFTFQKAA